MSVLNRRVNFENTVVTSVNVRSLMSNWNIFINSSAALADIICLQEVWRIKNKNLIQLNGFNDVLLKERSRSRGGGVAIYVKNHINYEELVTPFVEGVLESVGLKFKLQGKMVTLINIYIPPGKAKLGINLLKTYLDTHENVILVGDFNINIKRNTPSTRYFKSFCAEKGLVITNRDTTRLAGGSCIDHVVISKYLNIPYNCEVLMEEIADHLIIRLAFLSNSVNQVPQHNELTYNDCSSENIRRLRHSMNLTNWNDVITNDPEESVKNLINKITDNYNECCPRIKRKFNSRKDPLNSWMTKELLEKRNNLIKLTKKSANGTIVDKLRYKLEKQSYKHAINRAKNSKIESDLNNSKNDNSKIWKVLNDSCGLKGKRNEILGLRINNKIVTNKKDIVKEFSKFYKTEASRLKTLLNYSTEDHKKYLEQKPYTWSFTDVTREETFKTIKTLKNKKSTGFDNMNNFILKQIGDIVANPIAEIMNMCIAQGSFPDSLKTAKLVPIFKKGSLWEVSNYRPISLLPAISKIFEKLINTQLTEQIEDNDILPNTQFGFRKGKNTINAVELLVQEIQKAKILKEKVLCVFIDVSKAFDCCNHEILLNKLKSIGLNKTGVNLFKSYFSHRYQSVYIDEHRSENVEITMGVGQGTILGPTLFSLYLHDLPKSLDCLTIQFADDTTLLIKAKTEEELIVKTGLIMDATFRWLKDNGLTINQDKTRVMQFTGQDIPVTLNNQVIKRCGPNENEKYFNMLGIYLDKHLKWDYHIEKISCKISKGLYTLSKFSNIINTKSKLLVYHSLIASHLRYGISLWGKSFCHGINGLEKSLKQSMRRIENGKYHTDPIRKRHKILKLKDLYNQEMTIQAWKYYNKQLPSAIDNNLERRNIAHELRHDSLIKLPRITSSSDKNQFDYNLCNAINKLDLLIKNVRNLKSLKLFTKTRLVAKYKNIVTCNLPTCYECI